MKADIQSVNPAVVSLNKASSSSFVSVCPRSEESSLDPSDISMKIMAGFCSEGVSNTFVRRVSSGDWVSVADLSSTPTEVKSPNWMC